MNYPIAYVDWFLTITEELGRDPQDLSDDVAFSDLGKQLSLMTKSFCYIDKYFLYSFLRPYQKNLIELFGSFRTTAIFSLTCGIFQLLFLGQLILITLYWHFSRLQSMSDSCGSLSLIDINLFTIFCFFRINIPGNVIMIPFAGFCVWPLCLIASK
jgi:hypothetical protein